MPRSRDPMRIASLTWSIGLSKESSLRMSKMKVRRSRFLSLSNALAFRFLILFILLPKLVGSCCKLCLWNVNLRKCRWIGVSLFLPMRYYAFSWFWVFRLMHSNVCSVIRNLCIHLIESKMRSEKLAPYSVLAFMMFHQRNAVNLWNFFYDYVGMNLLNLSRNMNSVNGAERERERER